ncbi:MULTISPECIES: hypothetical protein [unclassified Streptomyces]|uniref:hypothetical protein n=1 Tax=unclassified Streptomyces TaxID=2593676 RepID=UPI002DDBEE15|nr:hypothetical protein [Streptomyces sp. NBC_01750]WSB03936.1 hypothetical protein OIE54_34530 [Streptomyces sp. NBC_01794]WSD31778.1 hypothetical protein OG966_07530 [Streptomyces sp. NBC_01750]
MAETGTGEQRTRQRTGLVQGPGLLLLWLYGVMSVGAVSRSVYQILTDYDSAPLAHTLSAVAAVVYAFITYTLVRGGETARRAALVCCAAELVGVLVVGTWTVVEPSAFPDSTVWSAYGMGYLFIPVVLPITGMLWLRRSRTDAAQPAGRDGRGAFRK